MSYDILEKQIQRTRKSYEICKEFYGERHVYTYNCSLMLKYLHEIKNDFASKNTMNKLKHDWTWEFDR